MDIDTNSDAYKAGERIGHYLTDAIEATLKAIGDELLENAHRMEPLLADMPTPPGVYTPSGPVVDSTSTPIANGVLALPERKSRVVVMNVQTMGRGELLDLPEMKEE